MAYRKPKPWDPATRKGYTNNSDLCSIGPGPQPAKLGVNLNAAAKDKYEQIYRYGNKGTAEHENIKRDMCVQWNNAVRSAINFSTWYGSNDMTPVVMVDMNNAIFGFKAELGHLGLSPNKEYDMAVNTVTASFHELAQIHNGIIAPRVNFILVNTNAKNGTLTHNQPTSNLVQLYVPCYDDIYGQLCKIVHGFAEIDDMFIVIVSSWLKQLGVDVSIFSHDKYGWWKNPTAIPRAYFGFNGEIYKSEYIPGMVFYGFKGFMGYMETTA